MKGTLKSISYQTKSLPCARSHHFLPDGPLFTASITFYSITVYTNQIFVVAHFHLDFWNKQDHQRWGYITVTHMEQSVYLAIWKDLNKKKRKEHKKKIEP